MTTEDDRRVVSALSEGLGPLYAERDHVGQGDYYTRHVSAMTGEKLHAKSAIAAELAHRDIEIERLRAALLKANDQAEEFERGWYLRGDALEVAVRQNEHDMLMTGEELRECRTALGPNV